MLVLLLAAVGSAMIGALLSSPLAAGLAGPALLVVAFIVVRRQRIKEAVDPELNQLFDGSQQVVYRPRRVNLTLETLVTAEKHGYRFVVQHGHRWDRKGRVRTGLSGSGSTAAGQPPGTGRGKASRGTDAARPRPLGTDPLDAMSTVGTYPIW